jgi:hypothetical protein
MRSVPSWVKPVLQLLGIAAAAVALRAGWINLGGPIY